MNLIRTATLFAVAVCLITNVSNGQDEKKKKKAQARGGKQVAAQLMGRFKGIDFSAEQKSKIETIVKKASAAIQEVRKSTSSILTADIRKARAAASKKARAEGLKGKEARAAVEKAAAIPAEAAEKLKALQKKLSGLQKEAREAIENVLTDEQKAKLPKAKGKGKTKKGKKKNDK